jgi:hypothetical protein
MIDPPQRVSKINNVQNGGGEIPVEQATLLASLALAVVRELGGATMLLDEDNKPQSYRLARCGPLALLEKPNYAASPQIIDCYLVLETVPHSSGRGDMFKLDQSCGLFSLERLHRATPAEFHLRARRNPNEWVGAVIPVLLSELQKRAPELFAELDLPLPSSSRH